MNEIVPIDEVSEFTKIACAGKGDGKVGSVMAVQIDLLKMRQTADLDDIPGLIRLLYQFIAYCQQNDVLATPALGYLATGMTNEKLNRWRTAQDPARVRFAREFDAIMRASIEMAVSRGIINPVTGIPGHDRF